MERKERGKVLCKGSCRGRPLLSVLQVEGGTKRERAGREKERERKRGEEPGSRESKKRKGESGSRMDFELKE